MIEEKKTADEAREEKQDIFDRIMSLPVLNIFEGFYKKNKSVLLYLFFGVLTTVVSFVAAGVAKVLLEGVGLGREYVSVISTVFSWICAVTFAFVTNRVWVFGSTAKGREIIKEGVSFYSGRVFTLVVETLMMWIGNGLLKFNYWAVKIIANVVVLILNYIISKVFVFKKRD